MRHEAVQQTQATERFYKPTRFVPLAQFATNWRVGAIGDDIRRYAPHLFRDSDGSGE